VLGRRFFLLELVREDRDFTRDNRKYKDKNKKIT
jgi:hypothetical protein